MRHLFFIISLIMYLTYISSPFVLGEKKLAEWDWKTFELSWSLGRLIYFPCFFLLLLSSPHFKPTAVSGQAVAFRECHSFCPHSYHITVHTKRRNCYQLSSYPQCCVVYIFRKTIFNSWHF